MWGAQREESSPRKPAGDSNSGKQPEGNNHARDGGDDDEEGDGTDYDPDVAHWRKPPIPSGTPTSASFRGGVEHDSTMIRTSGRSVNIVDPSTGQMVKLGSRRQS